MSSTAPAPAAAPTGHPACPNCGRPVEARYCGWCGQRLRTRLVSVRRLVGEVLDDQLSINGALPHTAVDLLRPGRITREYLAGRIVRYVPPFRLYLIASVALFLALGWRTDRSRSALGIDDPAPARAGDARRFHMSIGFADTTRAPRLLRPVARAAKRQEVRLNAVGEKEAVRLLVASLLHHAPRAAFLLVPVFALLLKLLYVRSRRFYVEHFVFSLHVHAFAFLLAAVALVAWSGWLASGLLLWLLGYLHLAMRAVYRQGLVKTTLKWALLGFGYTLALLLVVTAAMVVAVLTA